MSRLGISSTEGIDAIELVPPLRQPHVLGRLRRSIEQTGRLCAAIAYWCIDPSMVSDHLVRCLSGDGFLCVDIHLPTDIDILYEMKVAGANIYLHLLHPNPQPGDLKARMPEYLLHPKVLLFDQGGDIPWVSLADTAQLREVDYIATTSTMTTSDGIAHSSAHILPAGTVVFSRDATIGLCAITRDGMAVSQHFIGWICGARLMPEYLLLVLRSMTQELERATMGATVRTIGMPDVMRLAISIPPLPEQENVVRQIFHRRAQLNALVAKIREAIDRLKELRTALISAAVTGKIDVREEVA